MKDLKNLFRFGLAAITVTLMIAAVACKKDSKSKGGDDPPDGDGMVISATNIIVDYDDSDVVKVKAMAGYYDYDEYKAGESNYKNNSFKITLSETVPNKYLFSAYDYLEDEELLEDLQVNPINAKICPLDFRAYDRYDDEIGGFYQEDERSYSYTYATYVYADRNFTAKGTYSYQDYDYSCSCYDYYYETWNLNLKKGWNIMYISGEWTSDGCCYDETAKFTTQKPSGINLKWYYYDYDYWKSNDGSRTQKTPFSKKNSIFQKNKTKLNINF